MAEFLQKVIHLHFCSGYLTWNHEGDYEAVIDEYEH